MNGKHHKLTHMLTLAACQLCWALYASDVQARCEWSPGPTSINLVLDIGSVWVPRDAPVGTIIAERDKTEGINRSGGKAVCFYDSTTPAVAQLIPSTAFVPGIMVPSMGRTAKDNILKTNVPGIGAIITMAWPYDDSFSNTFAPDDGDTSLPYRGTILRVAGIGAPVERGIMNLKLIKTGAIAPGMHRISGELYHGTFTTLGKALDFSLEANVHQAQCTLKANAVSADPVMLGDHTVADFKGPGTATADVPFSITLSDCEDDPNGSTAYAHIYLEGTKGSTSVDPANGIFSLSTDATATGVGIQIRHQDGRVLPLEKNVPIKKLDLGPTRMDFKARYIQTAPNVSPGLATGALNFTISYR